MSLGQAAANSGDAGAVLLSLYDSALPHVYGYLLARCGQAPLAEDLAAETFLAAVNAAHRDSASPISIAWLVGVARHKLLDHWRRQAREQHGLLASADDAPLFDDPWDAQLNGLRAHETLRQLGPHHRAALTFRYLDDLSVPEVAALLERTIHATEALLVRARAAFRCAYEDGEDRRG